MSHYPTLTPGDTYRHFKGGLYIIVGLGCEEDSGAERVVYKSLKDGTIWLRAPWNFFQEVTRKVGGGETVAAVRRFTRVDVERRDPLAATNAALESYREVPNQE